MKKIFFKNPLAVILIFFILLIASTSCNILLEETSKMQSLEASGVVLRKPSYEQLPFQFDDLLQQAQRHKRDGSWAQAAHMFAYIAEHHRNEIWMKTLAAQSFYKAGYHSKATELSREINQRRPTVNSLLLEAKIYQEKKDFHSAIELLKRAEQILCNDTEYPVCAETSAYPKT